MSGLLTMLIESDEQNMCSRTNTTPRMSRTTQLAVKTSTSTRGNHSPEVILYSVKSNLLFRESTSHLFEWQSNANNKHYKNLRSCHTSAWCFARPQTVVVLEFQDLHRESRIKYQHENKKKKHANVPTLLNERLHRSSTEAAEQLTVITDSTDSKALRRSCLYHRDHQ